MICCAFKIYNILQQEIASKIAKCTTKNYLYLRESAAYLHSQLTKLLLTSHNTNYPRKNPIYLKRVYTLSNQIKFETLKSSLPLKRFVAFLLTTLNLRKLKMRQKRISRILPILISTTTNLHVYYVNITSYETLIKIKILL